MEHAIEASVRLTEQLRHVRTIVTDEPGMLVASQNTSSGRGGGRFDGALAIELGDGTRVEQAVSGELGPPVWADDALVLPVRWQPASHDHLLPAFAGEYELRSDPSGTRLLLRGAYTVPLGAAGRLGDWVAGRHLAQRVLDGHLAAVAERIDEATRRAVEAANERSGTTVASENFIG